MKKSLLEDLRYSLKPISEADYVFGIENNKIITLKSRTGSTYPNNKNHSIKEIYDIIKKIVTDFKSIDTSQSKKLKKRTVLFLQLEE
jgi:hypothetical protein